MKIENLTKAFPPDEKFRLTSQIIRSARSVNACIAEGHGRFTFPDRINFTLLQEAHSAKHIIIDAYDCNYISLEKLTELKVELEEVERILNGFINWLSSS